ncbi:hypothetical protein B0H14DRAFT_3872444 [Mycena olivaceomarginata]|nr:hypothetical protein B0H14DRAFT_3872444 [Mycena olivaceomarginata]
MRTSGIECRGDGGKGLIRIPPLSTYAWTSAVPGNDHQVTPAPALPLRPTFAHPCSAPRLRLPSTPSYSWPHLSSLSSPLYSACNRYGSERTTAPGARTPSRAGSLYARTGWAGLPAWLSQVRPPRFRDMIQYHGSPDAPTSPRRPPLCFSAYPSVRRNCSAAEGDSGGKGKPGGRTRRTYSNLAPLSVSVYSGG